MQVSPTCTSRRFEACTWIRLHEKGGKFHEVPAHHNASDYVDVYLKAAGLEGEKTPLFRTTRGSSKRLNEKGMSRFDVFRMIRRRGACGRSIGQDVLSHVPRYRHHGLPD